MIFKKVIVALVFLLAVFGCSSITAQTILGIKVGESLVNAKSVLKTRYGSKLYESSGNLKLSDFAMGPINFKYGELSFQWSGETSKMVGASFQDWDEPNETERLIQKRESLKNILGSKYALYEYVNKQGFKCYEFIGDEVDGITMHGVITIDRSEGNDGTKRLYLCLIYEPIAAFINDSSDF